VTGKHSSGLRVFFVGFNQKFIKDHLGLVISFVLFVILVKIFRPLCRAQLFVGFVRNRIVFFVAYELYHGVFVMYKCSVDFEALRANALTRNASKHVDHPMEVIERVQVSVDLPNEAEFGLTFFAPRIRYSLRGNPGWSSSDL
jgi:hypothetical protein